MQYGQNTTRWQTSLNTSWEEAETGGDEGGRASEGVRSKIVVDVEGGAAEVGRIVVVGGAVIVGFYVERIHLVR